MRSFRFTDHVIDRYIERCAPELSHAEAVRALEAATKNAKLLKEKTHDKYNHWLLDNKYILITKVQGCEYTCITILSAEENSEAEDDEEEMLQAYKRLNLKRQWKYT